MQTEKQAAIGRIVEHWASMERAAMPSFFAMQEGNDTYDLYRRAIEILRNVSFMTPHYMHGWAVGVEGRKFDPDKKMLFANEFEVGYITGWCQMDAAMKREGDI